MNRTLHMILDPGNALGSCLRFARSGDTVLLADQGVLLLAEARVLRELPVPMRALHADVAARGLLHQAALLGVELIDDHAWVGLVAQHPHVVSWK